MTLNYFPGIDITENTFAWLVNGVAGTTFLGINLLVVLSFPLVAALAYLVIRMTGLTRPLAIALAVAFAVIPFHWGRALGHTYLSTLYSAVVGLALVLLVSSGTFERLVREGSRRRRALAIAVVALMCVVVAWTGVYYLVFTLILGLFALLWRLAHRASWSSLAVDALPFVGTAVLAAIGFLPSLLTMRADPPLASLGERMVSESVTNAGSLVMAILPAPESSLPRMGYYNEAVLTAFADAPFGESTAITNFGTWVTALALLVTLVALVVRSRRPERASAAAAPVGLGLIAYLTVVVVLFFVPYGLNFLFAGPRDLADPRVEPAAALPAAALPARRGGRPAPHEDRDVLGLLAAHRPGHPRAHGDRLGLPLPRGLRRQRRRRRGGDRRRA